MYRKLANILKVIPLLPLMVVGRLMNALGKSEQFIQFMSKQANSPRSKKRPFANYKPTANDVFVATFAKSGTYWMMQISQQIAYYGSAEFEHIHDLVPWPDFALARIEAQLGDPTISQRAPTGLRIIKTHFEQIYVPFEKQTKYISVIRDPKEVIVSSYYFAKGMFNPMGITYDFEQWVAMAMQQDRFVFGDWAVHTDSWWALRHEPNMFVLTYNELKKNPATNIQKIADLMEVSLTPNQFANVLERSSFAWMKAHESQFKPPMPPQGRNNEAPLMMRSGKTGNSSELLSSAQQTAIDQLFRTKLKQLNSDFPYDEMFC